MSVSVWEVIHYSTNCNRRSLSLSLRMCAYVCVYVCVSVFEPLLGSYPFLLHSLARPPACPPPRPRSPSPGDNRAAHASPPPSTPPLPLRLPSLLLKLFQQEGREREKVTNHAVSEKSLFPPLWCVCMRLCVSLPECTCTISARADLED